MADNFPIDVAQIVALFLESVFYGIYLVTFGLCVNVLLFSKHTRPGGRRKHRFLSPFFLVALLLFIIATLDEALLLRHVLDAFVWYKGPGGAKEEFADISYWVNVMKTVTYVAQTSIADAMLIYRCYVVYGRRWLIAVALSILWIACMICEAFTCYIEFTLHSNAFLNASELSPFITSVLTLTLTLNFVATSMIVYKIYTIQRQTAHHFVSSAGQGRNGGALRRAMRIVIESGAMYSVAVFVFFVVYLAGNNAQYGVSDCVVQVIGMAFNLMIIRLDQGRTIEAHTSRSTGNTGSQSIRPFSTIPPALHLRFKSGSMSEDVQPMELLPGTTVSTVSTDKLERVEFQVVDVRELDGLDGVIDAKDGSIV
ncbi:hypothetical protein BXZ70DRAFT_520696 [Cristinia sonorae]|uniref:Uncharacterized protein n=1 Tax=Cristinia sonorae TaxID=1940300 RepID=A0A8K0UVC0_9AGAR|nr:hypothetical protein BXZ70DRAFT_520696 [Cristinia sonorae]